MGERETERGTRKEGLHSKLKRRRLGANCRESAERSARRGCALLLSLPLSRARTRARTDLEGLAHEAERCMVIDGRASSFFFRLRLFRFSFCSGRLTSESFFFQNKNHFLSLSPPPLPKPPPPSARFTPSSLQFLSTPLSADACAAAFPTYVAGVISLSDSLASFGTPSFSSPSTKERIDSEVTFTPREKALSFS